MAVPERAMSFRKLPSLSTRSGTALAGRTGLPSTSTRCSPTRNPGMALARCTASLAAGPATIRLAADRIPSRWARSTARLTSTAAPKSSAVTISLRKSRDDHVFAVPEELEELHALPQAAHQHVARGEHLLHDLGDLGGTEVELLVEVLDRFEDLGVAEMRIIQRRDLGAVFRQKVHIGCEPAILLGLVIEKGSGIGSGQRHLDSVRIDFLGESQRFLDRLPRFAGQSQDESAVHDDAQFVAVARKPLGDLDQQ